ncbi:hypothetical protein GCM10029978_055670 [Actinoallomurus acanthiterrae]
MSGEAHAAARANLSAGRLSSYGFAVEATMGQRPMRYLIGRRIAKGTAVTGLFVVEPDSLSGTHVWITENHARRECCVQTYVPTMRTSVRLVERYVFACLPLTDIGYLDLMAWRYPGLDVVPADIEVDMSWSRWRSAESRCYLGPGSTPGLTVTEATDSGTGVVVARVVERRREQFRRWEVLELGDDDIDGLPKRIRVSRPQTGRWTEFHRDGEPLPLPEEAFDGDPRCLRAELEHQCPGRVC